MVFQLKNNQSTKNIVSGAAAIGIATVAGIVAAPSAHAAQISFTDWVTTPVTVGDKIFTYTSSTGLPSGTDIIDIEQVNGDYIFTYDLLPDFTGDSFTLAYTVDITPEAIAAGAVFQAVDLDATVDAFTPPDETLVTTFAPNVGGPPVTLTSSNGSSAALPINDGTSLTVTNTYTRDPVPGRDLPGEISSFENSFRQVTTPPQPTPEPASILGLLAVGGLGLGLTRKKQS